MCQCCVIFNMAGFLYVSRISRNDNSTSRIPQRQNLNTKMKKNNHRNNGLQRMFVWFGRKVETSILFRLNKLYCPHAQRINGVSATIKDVNSTAFESRALSLAYITFGTSVNSDNFVLSGAYVRMLLQFR